MNKILSVEQIKEILKSSQGEQCETIRTLTAQLEDERRKSDANKSRWDFAEKRNIDLTAQLADAVEAIRQINYQSVNCMSINSLRKHIKGISRSVLEANHD